jgi:hypothetical protein
MMLNMSWNNLHNITREWPKLGIDLCNSNTPRAILISPFIVVSMVKTWYRPMQFKYTKSYTDISLSQIGSSFIDTQTTVYQIIKLFESATTDLTAN